MKVNEVLVKPVVTEKASVLANAKTYMFITNVKANKNQIKEALEKIYKVKVDYVKIMVRKGKTRKVGKKMAVKQLPNKKIAFIKLSEGKIDLFPQA